MYNRFLAPFTRPYLAFAKKIIAEAIKESRKAELYSDKTAAELFGANSGIDALIKVNNTTSWNHFLLYWLDFAYQIGRAHV